LAFGLEFWPPEVPPPGQIPGYAHAPYNMAANYLIVDACNSGIVRAWVNNLKEVVGM